MKSWALGGDYEPPIIPWPLEAFPPEKAIKGLLALVPETLPPLPTFVLLELA